MNCRDSNKCYDNIDKWISEAPQALNEFILVKQEVLSNKTFVNKFSVNGSIFLRVMDTSIYHYFFMPQLKKWFQKGRGYINFEKNDTSCCFKECGYTSAAGYIYYKSFGRQRPYRSEVNIVDSATIGLNWIAHVITCNGCDD
jgi:hypothetical protein